MFRCCLTVSKEIVVFCAQATFVLYLILLYTYSLVFKYQCVLLLTMWLQSIAKQSSACQPSSHVFDNTHVASATTWKKCCSENT